MCWGSRKAPFIFIWPLDFLFFFSQLTLQSYRGNKFFLSLSQGSAWICLPTNQYTCTLMPKSWYTMNNNISTQNSLIKRTHAHSQPGHHEELPVQIWEISWCLSSLASLWTVYHDHTLVSSLDPAVPMGTLSHSLFQICLKLMLRSLVKEFWGKSSEWVFWNTQFF